MVIMIGSGDRLGRVLDVTGILGVLVMPPEMVMNERCVRQGQMRMDVAGRDEARQNPHQLKRRDEERLQRPHGCRL